MRSYEPLLRWMSTFRLIENVSHCKSQAFVFPPTRAIVNQFFIVGVQRLSFYFKTAVLTFVKVELISVVA